MSSAGSEEHLTHLDEVFGILCKARVSLKAGNCFLFHDEFEYLGYAVGKHSLRVNQNYLVGLREAKPLRTKKDLRSFLGVCSVSVFTDYAKVARPLLAMNRTKELEPLPEFSQKQTAAFEDLKDRLTHTPILALPRREGLYIVDTDASATQLGCVLLQEEYKT